MLKLTSGHGSVKFSMNRFSPFHVNVEIPNLEEHNAVYLYTSPRVTSLKPHLMCLAPSQHCREGLLIQSGPLFRDQGEWSKGEKAGTRLKKQRVSFADRVSTTLDTSHLCHPISQHSYTFPTGNCHINYCTTVYYGN